MKSELLRHFRSLFQEKKVRFNKRILIFFYFLLLSTFIWLLSSLDKEYIAELNFPVNYYNFPEDRIETEDLPEFFTLRVESSGYLLLKHRISRSVYPLQIDISKYLPENLINDTVGFNINTSNFREGIENQLSQQIKVIDIKPENVRFLFARKESKLIPVFANAKYIFDNKFIVKGSIKIKPEKVFVSGPVNILDTLSCIPTIHKEIGPISGLTHEKLMLQGIQNLSYDISYVNVTVDAEKYTETSIMVPLTVMNVPDSIIIQLNPEKVRIDYCTGLSSYSLIKASHFNLVVDYNELSKTNSSKLSVLVKNAPIQAFNLKMFPKTVDFVIKTRK